MSQRDQRDRELQFRHVKVVENSRTARHFVTWAGVVLLAFFAYKSIEALAGKTTFADILVRLAARIDVNHWVAYVLGGAGTVYGLTQSKLRRKTVKRLGGRIRQLEEALDPHRTSSSLDREGRTPE